jgi:integrase
MANSDKLLTPDEIAAVSAWLHHRRRRGPNFVLNRAIFRLACCCGLRRSEMCRLNMGHIIIGAHPTLCIESSAGNPRRIVPFGWDKGTLMDLAGYTWMRKQQAASSGAPFLCGVTTNAGKRLTPDLVAKRWRALMRVVLGEEKAKQLSIHAGRRTFATFASTHGRSPDEIARALGTSPDWARRQLR